jgi:hypothetical protein
MTRGPLRLILSVCLLWTGMNVCLMPQAECEAQARPCCHCHHASRHKCCTGIHLIEAGVQSGVSSVAPASPQAALAQPGPSYESGAVWHGPLAFAVATALLHPPPRECLGRSPPIAS